MGRYSEVRRLPCKYAGSQMFEFMVWAVRRPVKELNFAIGDARRVRRRAVSVGRTRYPRYNR